MDRVYASLERIRALWLQLEKTRDKTPEYDALIKKVVASRQGKIDKFRRGGRFPLAA